MKNNKKTNKGMTLIELTVVILVLLSLIAVLFIGAKAWKDGSDRAQCILNIRNFQTAVRSYANMNEIANGKGILVADLIGPDNFLGSFPVCPSGGKYTPGSGDTISYTTSSGKVFLSCDKTGHAPKSGTTGSW